jgi:hypothetical protein
MKRASVPKRIWRCGRCLNPKKCVGIYDCRKYVLTGSEKKRVCRKLRRWIDDKALLYFIKERLIKKLKEMEK